jgi:hypothetical protein
MHLSEMMRDMYVPVSTTPSCIDMHSATRYSTPQCTVQTEYTYAHVRCIGAHAARGVQIAQGAYMVPQMLHMLHMLHNVLDSDVPHNSE